MNKFYAFAWQQYEAGGGLNDLKGVFDTFADAEKAVARSVDDRADIATIDADGEFVLQAEYTKSPFPLTTDGAEDTRSSIRLPYRWLKLINQDDIHRPIYSELKSSDD